MFGKIRIRATTVTKRPRSGLTVMEIGVIFCIIVILIALLLPSVRSAGGAARRSVCRNNLKQLGLALHNYHDVYGSFPPAYVVDESGNPLYSWRVLILPFVEQPGLYDKLHLDEPWDSPHNRPLLMVDIPTYRCASDQQWAEDSETEVITGMTNYLAVVGPQTVWPMPNVCTLDDITDDKAKTILVAEVKNSGIHWAEPRDLHVTQMAGEINPQSGMGLSSQHEGGLHVLWGDGSVEFLSDATPRQTVRALMTRAGGEEVDDEF